MGKKNYLCGVYVCRNSVIALQVGMLLSQKATVNSVPLIVGGVSSFIRIV